VSALSRSGPVIVLVGPPGAGKSTVGRLLARRLGMSFKDTDVEIERRTGKKISDIFGQDGEPAFRAAERDTVRTMLAAHDGVLALGGGAVTDETTRALLRGHPVAFLAVDVAEAVHRVGDGRDRPLLAGDAQSRLAKLIADRRPYYEQVATWTVVTDRLTAEEVAEQLLATLRVRTQPTEDSRKAR
jgi:shikimate kinase